MAQTDRSSVREHCCTVVGVAASTGAQDSFLELVSAIPADTGIAFVLVEDVPPGGPGLPVELLQRRTALPAVKAADGMALTGNRIYLSSGNENFTVANGSLCVTQRTNGAPKLPPIDSFLVSLAEDLRDNAIGVVLSGSGADGVLGLRAIKDQGGITFAQDASARFDAMPRSAIAAGVIDFVLPPRQISTEICALARRRLDRAVLSKETPAFLKILRLLRAATGIDFPQYKAAPLLRRLQRRLVLQNASPAEYLEMLLQHPAEVGELAEDLLINVTGFFREPPLYRALQQNILPSIAAAKTAGDCLRVWVPGCSTGEEIYSIAICLSEFLDEAPFELPFQIFSSDASERSLERARAGIYSPGAVSALSPERLKSYFTPVGSGYQVIRKLRDKCVFAVQDLTSDPPYPRLDLISCRNVLGYFGRSLQHRVMAEFAFALQSHGFLVCENDEKPAGISDNFLPHEAHPYLFQPKRHRIRGKLSLPARVTRVSDLSLEAAAETRARNAAGRESLSPLQNQVDLLLLSEFAPPSILVDGNMNIVEIRGEVQKFLSPATGGDVPDVPRSLSNEGALHLRAAVEEARRQDSGIRLEGVHIPGSPFPSVQVTVTPVNVADLEQHFLITFAAGAASAAPQAGEPAPAKAEFELTAGSGYVQSVVEELRAANQDAQSFNEELQSSNEELQAVREELQVSNEELQTVNAEVDHRNVELRRLTADLLNLLTSLNTPILMLDMDLRIRRFTHVTEELLNVLAADIGRPISDLKPRINLPNLDGIARQVLDTLTPQDREVQDQNGRWHSLRVRPYRTTDNRIDGVVLQLVDIDELKRSLESARHASEYAAAIIESVREPLAVLNSEFCIETANRAFLQTFSTSAGDIFQRPVYEVAGKQLDTPLLHNLLRDAAHGNARNDAEMECNLGPAGRRNFRLNARRVENPGPSARILLAFEDITGRKQEAEVRYRRLFEAAKDGILIASAGTGEIIDVNPFLETLSGYSREELVGRKLKELESLSGITGIDTALERIHSQEIAHFGDVPFQTKAGGTVYVDLVANEYRESGSRVIQFNIRDITERKRFERQLQQTQKLESLGVLAGGIAHDFNNLLTGIIGNASLGLADAPETMPARRYFREIVSASHRAAELTRQMLAYAGKGQFVIELVDVSQLIREIQPLLQSSISKMVAVTLELSAELPFVEADPGQIQQLVMNLVLNGAEAVGQGSAGSVTVQTRVRELTASEIQLDFPGEPLAPGHYVEISVHDNGSGMDEATRARIFDPFFTTKFHGRGLGLAAAAGIVRSHKGAIQVHSSPGKGSSLHVLLPAKPRETASASAGEAPAIPASGVVLLVDDEEMVRRVAETALQRRGWQVILARNGAEGVELFARHRNEIALVILDLAMPVMGGEEALERMRAVRSSVPIIVSSGYNQREAARRFAGRSLAGFLQKPYTIKQLMDAVNQAVEHE